MSGAVYYNEFEPYAADWLENLIAAGQLPAGDVDRRDIREVTADDLEGYDECHFFAGIGGWPYALALAGWRGPVWTGSCPCPPFSSAGREKACPACGGGSPIPCPRRTGFFICCHCEHAWLADGRHLWPELWRLIRDRRPPVVFGEQVASKDGRIWLAGVRASLEILAYDPWGADLCAAGAGAPHIRQRLFWVADARHAERRAGHRPRDMEGRDALRCERQEGSTELGERGQISRLVDADERNAGAEGLQRSGQHGQLAPDGCAFGRVADAKPQYDGSRASRPGGRPKSANSGAAGQLGDAAGDGAGRPAATEPGGDGANHRIPRETGALGFWRDFDLIPCADGKARRVEPGSFPLAHGFPQRVGKLRAYGNAIVPQAGAAFVSAFMECRP